MTQILFWLKCGHLDQGTVNDAKRSNVFCHRCNSVRAVQRVQTKEWMACCYDCIYVRWYGINKGLARDGARRHSANKPRHRSSYAEKIRPAAQEAKHTLINTGCITG
jgi:hypothetical protein